MAAADTDHHTERRANELYWGSHVSVNQIAEDLDLSKGMLYGLIHPLPAGLMCPDCSEELVYPNRTARERSMVVCANCGWEGDEDDTDVYGGGKEALPAVVEGGEAAGDADESADRSRILLGGALVGAAAGLALVIWARRR
ncbi:MAG: hypothetical protein PVJ02_01680 [Gemmatimonadota bacterium]|jgi:hypothetical protein